MSLKKIGIFGGTFDPVHNGHIVIAQTSIEQLELDEVWFLLEKKPRNKIPIASYNERFEMLKIATAKHSKIKVKDVSSLLKIKEYNLETLKLIKNKHPQVEFWMIMGADVMAGFKYWKDYDEFIALTGFGIAHREGDHDLKREVELISEKFPNFRYKIINVNNSVSSSNVRDQIKSNKLNQLPEGVDSYVSDNNLYS